MRKFLFLKCSRSTKVYGKWSQLKSMESGDFAFDSKLQILRV